VPYGLSVDGHGNVWITDVALHQVGSVALFAQFIISLGDLFLLEIY